MISDKRETQNKILIILSNSADYLRWKSYIMSELKQQRYGWTVTVGKKRPAIKSICEKLMEKEFISAQLILQILINRMM